MAKKISSLKKELWSAFGLYIKVKHSVDGVWCNCYTCGKPIKIGDNNCHAGHYISRRHLITCFNENNVRPQCSGCNIFKHGDPVQFRLNLVKEIGEEKVKEMENAKNQLIKLDRSWYETQIEYYKKRTTEL